MALVLALARKVSALNPVRSRGIAETNAPPAYPPEGSPGPGTVNLSEVTPR